MLKVVKFTSKNGTNHIMQYKGLRVAFHVTEWLDGDLYLHLNDVCVCCLDEGSYMLGLFETDDYVIDNELVAY